MRDLDLGGGVLVALHGHGDDPASARAWARHLAPAGWEIVAPGAPRDDDGTRSWFSTGPRGVDPVELRRSVGRVVDTCRRVRAGGRPVVVAGFSQGASLALEVAARSDELDGAVAVCGFMAEVDDDAARSWPGDVRVLVVGATRDEHVPSFMSEDAAALLSSHGRRVSSVVVDGGHEVGARAAKVAREWLSRALVHGARISLGLPVDRVAAGPELVSGDAIADLASAWERLGYHAVYVTDHPAPDDRWLAGGGHHALEPTVALAAAAVATRRLLLHTNVYVLGYRNPFLAAKSLATLDVVSDGRLIIGVAAGYLRPEFEALGAEFEERGRRLDETLELLPRIWSEQGVQAEGDGWSARSVTALPQPMQRPHPPIWVGGNSVAAMRRAVRRAQGWSPFPTEAGVERALRTAAIGDLAALQARLTQAAELCEEVGRTEPLTTCFVPFSLPGYLADPVDGLAPMVDEIAQLSSMGIDWVALIVPGSTRSEVTEHASALAAALGLG
ncbi:MAG: TIGR03619 family F420-dependent LLM class oxidoreductase [Microthrixaceae bacterium]